MDKFNLIGPFRSKQRIKNRSINLVLPLKLAPNISTRPAPAHNINYKKTLAEIIRRGVFKLALGAAGRWWI